MARTETWAPQRQPTYLRYTGMQTANISAQPHKCSCGLLKAQCWVVNPLLFEPLLIVTTFCSVLVIFPVVGGKDHRGRELFCISGTKSNYFLEHIKGITVCCYLGGAFSTISF